MLKYNALLSTLYSIIATYIEFFFGLVISVLIARQLGPEQYGQYGYMMWISALLMTLMSGGITLGSIKFIAEARATKSKHSNSNKLNIEAVSIHLYFKSLVFKQAIFFTLVSVGLVYLLTAYQLIKINVEMLYIVIAAAMLKSIHMYYVSVLKGFEDFRSLAILSGLITPFNLILTLVCYFTHQALIVYVVIYFIVSLMYLIISSSLLKKHVRSKTKKSLTKSKQNKILTQSFKLKLFHHARTASWISILGFIVLRQSELFFLNIYSTAEVMAYFNVGYTLASAAMTLVPGVYSAILLPLMSRLNKTESLEIDKQLNLSFRYMLQLIIALLFPVCFFAEEIFYFLYGEQYLNAVLPFQIIISCVAFKSLSDCTNAYLWSKDKQHLMLKVIIVSCIATIGLDYYFIKHYHLHGALFAFGIATLFFVWLNLVLVMRKFNTSLEWLLYFKTILSGGIAILLISPIGFYLPNILGVIIGSFAYIGLYILMLLSTISLSYTDIDLLRTLNSRYFKVDFFDRYLVLIQNKTHFQV